MHLKYHYRHHAMQSLKSVTPQYTNAVGREVTVPAIKKELNEGKFHFTARGSLGYHSQSYHPLRSSSASDCDVRCDSSSDGNVLGRRG